MLPIVIVNHVEERPLSETNLIPITVRLSGILRRVLPCVTDFQNSKTCHPKQTGQDYSANRSEHDRITVGVWWEQRRHLRRYGASEAMKHGWLAIAEHASEFLLGGLPAGRQWGILVFMDEMSSPWRSANPA